MKKVFPRIIFLIIVLIIFIGLAPRFLILEDVQKRFTNQVSKSLGSPISVNKMYWIWLPLPHLTFVNTTITTENYNFSLPKVDIYPTWRIIFGKTDTLRKIILDNPEIHINKTAFLTEKSSGQDISATDFPAIPITIKNGKLEVEFGDEYKDVLRTESLTLIDIRGNILLLPQKIDVDIHTSAPFSKNISLEGNFNIPDKTYNFSLDSRDLKLHKSVKAFFNGRLVPVESTANLSGTVTGKGLEHVVGNLRGTLPCFVVKPQDRKILLTCGYADLKLIKLGSLLRLDINDLEMKDPQVNLSGHVERKLSSPNSNEQFSAAEPVWTLDFVGGDLDLTAVRDKILTLWPDNKIAKNVCDIVLGGKALSASYSFSGRTADFRHMDAMIIKADVLNADIHVPGAELDLTRASGPIQIKDSVLTGHNLNAQLGSSYGRNAKLLLDLDKLGEKFMLDIDIDADLKDLPPVLAHLIKHDGFQRQLAKFDAVAGRASGNVLLGDSLHKIFTRVDVKNMEVEARYEPIPRKVVIDSGTLHIGPDKVSWQNAKGRIGQQEITNTSGNVSWQSGETLLNIEETQAQLEGASLLDLLKQSDVLPQKINNMLSSLDGAIEVTRGSLLGPALQPRAWKYNFDLKATDLTFTSPLLPEPASTEKFTATIDHGETNIQEAAIYFLDQTFNLKGWLRHDYLENWHGMIEFNGPVKSKLAEWTRSKGWFPDILRPRIPFTLKNFTVNWQGKTIGVSGNILQGLAGGKLPMARIDYKNTPEYFRINEFVFYAPGEQGRLKVDFWYRSPQKLHLTWAGYLNADTIDALFERSPLTAGSLSGDVEIDYFADQPEKTRFVGLLKTENLLLKTKEEDVPIIITNLDMTGSGRQVIIPAFGIAIGSEKITGSGRILTEKEVLQIDISLGSAFLSKESLSRLSHVLHESQNIFIRQTGPDPGLSKAGGWNITGRIGFDFDGFSLNRKTNMPYAGAQSVTYTFHDVHGDLQLAPDEFSRTEIFSAQLCGLGFKGIWFSNADLGQKFQFYTKPDETLRLENVLPCLGVRQDIVEGEFSLRANILKESNTLYAGNIYLTSSQGRILRLKTLSRIFRVVNITDLFEEQIETTGKRGFPFSQMDIDTHIEDNNLIIDRAIIRGEGLNLFAQGELDLADYDTDLSLLIAPFKTFDTIITKVPIIGKPVMGEYGSRVNIPVAIKGPINDPIIAPLHPEAVGEALLNIVRDTFMLPYSIFLKPLEQAGENTGQKTPGTK